MFTRRSARGERHSHALTHGSARWLLAALWLLVGCAANTDDVGETQSAADPLTLTTVNTGGGGTVTPPACNRVTACTYEHLVGGGCVLDAWPDGTSCSDGNACNGAETCLRGVCLSGVAPRCADSNPCTDDRCDAARGCYHTPNTGNACSDGYACTMVDRCEAGVCRGGGSTSGTPSYPTWSELTPSAPLPGRVLARDPIWYLAGATLDVSVILPTCSWVTGVTVGGRVLDTRPHTQCNDAGAPYDCEPRYYTVLRDEVLEPMQQQALLGVQWRHRLWLRVHLENPANGSAESMRITVASAAGSVPIDRTVAYVREATLNTSRDADGSVPVARVTVGETSLRNAYFAGMYAQFGSVGEAVDGAGNRVAYAPDFAGSNLAVTDAGVSFTQRFRVDLHIGSCNPMAVTTGRFHLEVQNHQVVVVWDSGPTIDLDYPFLCSPGVWVIGGPLYQLLVAMVTDDAASGIRTSLQVQIDAALGAATLSVQRVETHPGRIDAWLVPIFDRVSFDVQYDSAGLAYPAQWGLPLAANERVVVFVGGTTRVCERDTEPTTTCTAQTLGAEGTFNWADLSDDGGGSPVPDPWASASGLPAYYVTRDRARQRLAGLYRDPLALVRSSVATGSLMARFETTPSVHSALSVGASCTWRAPVAGRLGFGPNDNRPAGNITGTGVWDVTVMLLGFGAANGVPTCQ